MLTKLNLQLASLQWLLPFHTISVLVAVTPFGQTREAKSSVPCVQGGRKGRTEQGAAGGEGKKGATGPEPQDHSVGCTT